jgi:uncharacterized membrane protein
MWKALLAVVVAAAAFIVTTASALPDCVATHFGASNLPNGWMTRTGYVVFMLAFASGMPLVLAAAVGLLPRLAPHAVNLPNREYWLAPTRREASLRYLEEHGCRLGVLFTGTIALVHVAILRAHETDPPVLPMAIFLPVLLGTLVGTGIWALTLFRRFRRVPRT